MCQGEWVQVSASGTESYQWYPSAFFQDPSSQVTAVSPPETTEITVVGSDEFGCQDSESRTIIVHPEPFAFAGPDVEVNWGDLISLYGQASDSVDFEWSPTTYMEDPDDLTPILLPDESTYYELSVVDQYGCTSRDTVFVKVILPIYVPNTFTPDGDGLNDVFRAYGDNILEFHMQIYDRWGDLVFESFTVDKVWDGSKNGGDHYVQDDLFVWRIVYETKNGKEELTGHVTILR
jgi:gliding motility-associated-like protein